MEPRLFFLTDFPPRTRKAISNHGIAANFIRIMRDRFALVITHRFRREITTAGTRADFPEAEFFFYPDAGGLGLKRFAPGFVDVLDIALCLLALPRLRRLAREKKPTRLFVLVGGSAWFLAIACLVAAATRLPMDVMLVDDLLHSAKLARRRLLPHLVHWLEGAALRRASRVFGISQGYAEHLTAIYGVPAQWMPTPIHAGEIRHRPFEPETPDTRTILFIGANNDLYVAALAEVYAEIKKWNAAARGFRLRLRMLSPDGAAQLRGMLPDCDDLEVIVQAPPEEIARQAQRCWATLLPYSFLPRMATMVSTSFSWKLSDSYRSGRPILVYGPPYASIPRYFREAGLPLCATARAELLPALAEIEKLDSPDLIARYRATWERFHSPEAVIRNLAGAREC